MTEERTKQAEEIFFAALEIESPEQRRQLLERECRGDADLRSLVEELLAAQLAANKFFRTDDVVRLPVNELAHSLDETPGLAESLGARAGQDEFVGKSIGPYKLLQRIGEGGCGAVYMAEQEKPVRRKVAFKIIKLGMDTKSVIARFEAERQALALMDHPNIARVLDAGATETGRPYFVMELVRGVKITDYCDQNELDAQQRLELFIQVCQAIQHAHQKGVIHRDIKPSNILVATVDGKPVPKVIDFGIAKAIEGRLADNTIFTPYEHFIGTPAYMSPEQAVMSGVDVDTRSDIYSLGVLLYELLTGRTPFETKALLEHGIDGLRRTLQEEEPQRPSVFVTTMQGSALTQMAQHRHAEPSRLISTLRGDLDWIVMKALEKERQRRYQTANGLAVDVQRFLDNEPVIARPPSRAYRFQKLVRRNRTVFLAIGAVSLALVVGLGVSSWLFIRERQARREQVRLRELAEQAQRNESELRDQAEARSKIALAVLMLNRGKTEEADRLLDQIQVPVTEPSLEAANLFRDVGDWNVLQGRWKQASKCYLNMVTANRVDKTDMTDDATRNLLRVGPALIAAGDVDGYRHFVRSTIVFFHDSTNPVAAEQIVKISLLLPADRDVIQSLEPLARVVAQSISESALGNSRQTYMLAWRALAITLYEYRSGDFDGAMVWGRRCLEYRDQRPTSLAMGHLILAMAYAQTHQSALAEAELAQGRKLVTTAIPDGLSKISSLGGDPSGFWYDWLYAGVLLGEAKALIQAHSSSGN